MPFPHGTGCLIAAALDTRGGHGVEASDWPGKSQFHYATGGTGQMPKLVGGLSKRPSPEVERGRTPQACVTQDDAGTRSAPASRGA